MNVLSMAAFQKTLFLKKMIVLTLTSAPFEPNKKATN